MVCHGPLKTPLSIKGIVGQKWRNGISIQEVDQSVDVMLTEVEDLIEDTLEITKEEISFDLHSAFPIKSY